MCGGGRRDGREPAAAAPAGADRGTAPLREGLRAQREPQTAPFWLERPAPATDSMPPKRNKAARTDDGPPDWSLVTVELRGGEKDAQNVGYHAAVLEAWQIVLGHPVFDGMEAQDPLSIANGGVQAPFSQRDLETSCLGKAQAYACGINLSWVNLTYSATPGIPIRMAAVREVTEKDLHGADTHGEPHDRSPKPRLQGQVAQGGPHAR